MKFKILLILIISSFILISYSSDVNAIKCSDTDGGQSFFSIGTVKDSSGGMENGYNDFCGDPDGVYEGYCENDNYNLVYKSCASFGKFVCRNGACIAGTCVKYPGAIVTKSCVDSDNGIIKETRGPVSFSWSNTSGSGNSNSVDYCSALDEVNEYFCDGNNVGFQKIKCYKGDVCSNGICTSNEKKKVCQDSDGTNSLIFGNTY